MLLLHHPQMLKVDCNDCQKRLYDLETGEPKTYRAGPNREICYYEGQPPPCRTGTKCPKGSPEEAHEHELSEKNWRVFNIYRRGRAIGFAGMVIDDLLASNLTLVDGLVRSRERWQSAEAIGANFATHLTRMLPFIRNR